MPYHHCYDNTGSHLLFAAESRWVQCESPARDIPVPAVPCLKEDQESQNQKKMTRLVPHIRNQIHPTGP